MMVLHRCDVRACISIDHLYLGTGTDNAADRDSRNRNGMAKLTDKDRETIKELYATGNYSLKELGQKFGVHHSQIHRTTRNQYGGYRE